LNKSCAAVYAGLGVIYKEAHYQRALQIELSLQGYDVTTEQHAPTMYIDSIVGARHNIYNDRTDMLVYNSKRKTRYLLELKHDNFPEKPDNVNQALRYYKNLEWINIIIDGVYIIGFPKTLGHTLKIKKIFIEKPFIKKYLNGSGNQDSDPSCEPTWI